MQQNWKKQFAVIYAGQAFSILGSAAVQFAIIWWLTVQTESAITLTIATLAAFLPTLLLGPVAGVWIDRHNRRTVMMLADGVVALSSVILGLVFLFDPAPSLWLIYAMLLVRGVGGTFHGPAMQAAIPLLVPGDMLTQAGGWGNLVNSFSAMLGPVLGAALMGFMPIAAIMLVDIAGAVLAIVCLAFVKIPDVPKREGKPQLWADMKEGMGLIIKNKPLISLFIPMFLVNLIFMPLGALYPLLVRTHFMGEAWHNSIIEFVFAGGMLISSAVVGVWGGMRNRFLMVSLAIGVLGATSAVCGVLPSNGFVILAVACFLMGTTGTFINVPVMAYVQESTAPEMMGKVFSILLTASTLAMPAGLLISGPVSEVIGVDQWFLWSGVALVVTAIISRIVTKPYEEAAMRPNVKKTETSEKQRKQE